MNTLWLKPCKTPQKPVCEGRGKHATSPKAAGAFQRVTAPRDVGEPRLFGLGFGFFWTQSSKFWRFGLYFVLSAQVPGAIR